MYLLIFQLWYNNFIMEDKEIDKIMDSKIKEFDDNKKLTSDYLSIDYSESTINRYREKLKKI